MHKNINLGILLSISCLLSSCAPIMERTALTPEHNKEIKKIDQGIIVSQKKLIPNYAGSSVFISSDPTVLAAGALVTGITAIIADIKNKNADKLIQPLIQETGENEFTNNFRHSLIAELNKNNPIHSKNNNIKVIHTEEKNSKNTYPNMKNYSNGEAFFYIPMVYKLNDKMDALMIHVTPELQLKQNNVVKTIYTNRFDYIKPLPNAGKNKKENLELWKANHGKLVHQYFQEAAPLLAKYIINDLKPIDNKTITANNKQKVIIDKGFFENTDINHQKWANVQVLEKRKNLLVFRKETGSIEIASGRVIS